MNEITILNFEEQLLLSKTKNIIIGNGFGVSFDQAFEKHCYNWNNLLDLCDIPEGSPLHNLLLECDLDFELAHQKLNNAIDVLQEYSDPKEQINFYLQQIDILREQLTKAVSASHPDSFSYISDEEELKIINCRNFLSQFQEIYSLNYDLLLYWLRCYKSPCIGNDSFRNSTRHDDLVFNADDKSNIFFPHGALFLNRNGISATKVRSSQDNPILAVVQRNIENGVFPMTVTEGRGNQKEEVIRGNEYLNYCFERLQKVEGTVFTFGCSFRDGKDEHIIKQLLRSPVEKIIIGEYSPDKSTVLRLLYEFEKVQKKQGARRIVPVFVADTSQVDIW